MRTRFDNQLGWQCVCGNDDLHTKQELQVISNQASPTPEINTIVKNLKVQKSKFEMVSITWLIVLGA